MPDFLPQKELELLAWSANFREKIVDSPGEYNLSVDQAAAYTAAHDAFASALAVTNTPATRSPTTILAKEIAKAAIKSLARALAKAVRGGPMVTSAQRIALGLRPIKEKRSRIGPPATGPLLNVLAIHGWQATIQLRDSASLFRRGMRQGVSGAIIYWSAGDQMPAADSDWNLVKGTSRGRFEISLSAKLTPGTKVWLAARYFNARGPGPMGTPTYTYIQFGAVRAAA